MSRLLEGYRVIESAQLINGDRLGMFLGDLGADVIKVESPFRGDYIRFCAIEHHFWDNFCRAVGREDLLEAKDTSTPVDFAGGDTELRRELQQIFHTRTLAEWLDVAREHDVAMGPTLRTIDELRDDPHLSARGIFVESSHPKAGPFTYLAEPGIVQGQPYEVRLPAPLLGEQTDGVLGELGYSSDRIATLRADGIV